MGNQYLNNKIFEGAIFKFQLAKKKVVRFDLILEDLNNTIDRKTQRNINCDKDNESLISYQKLHSDAKEEYTLSQKELAMAFYILSENIVRYAKFNLIDPDDAIQEGVMICFEKVDRFNPNYRSKSGQKAKAFNYMTTCILNHFRQLYRTARNYNELKKKYQDFIQVLSSRTIIQNGKELPFFNSISKF